MSATAATFRSTARPLGVRKRSDLELRPLFFASRRHWTVKDPVALRYYQLRDEECFVLRLLDGQASLDDVCWQFDREFAPRRLSAEQLQVFLGTLHEQGLIVSSAAGQGAVLLSRGQRARRRAWLARWANPLAIRFRGVDPARLLDWLVPKCRCLFTARAAAIALALVLWSLAAVLLRMDALAGQVADLPSFLTSANVFGLLVAIATTKMLHELGHAVACRHYGGDCQELGLMLLVFTPCLYCNVSDAWTLRSKWQRIGISAAGMIVEVVLAAVAGLVWAASEPGVVNSLALNLMIVCSVNTMLLNGNPLLRYDGYHILADLVETPNLAEQSSAALRSSAWKWLTGVEPAAARVLPERGRGWLALYAVASTAYRWFVVFAVLWLVQGLLEPHGLEVLAKALAVIVLAGMAAEPVWRAARFLNHPSHKARIDKRRLLLRGGGLLAIVAGLLLAPLPYRVGAPALLEPQGAKNVYVTAAGTLLESLRPGAVVKAGDVLARLENLELRREVTRLAGEQAAAKLRLDNLLRQSIDNPLAADQVPVAKEALAELDERLRLRRLDEERLTLVAPADGIVMPPPSDDSSPPESGELPRRRGTPLDEWNVGTFLETGAWLCRVGDPRRLEAVLAIEQADVEFVQPGQRTWLRLDELPGATLSGEVVEVSQRELPEASRELAAQGETATEAGPDGSRRPLKKLYQARVRLDTLPQAVLIGAAGSARIEARWRSLADRVGRFLSSTFRLTW